MSTTLTKEQSAKGGRVTNRLQIKTILSKKERQEYVRKMFEEACQPDADMKLKIEMLQHIIGRPKTNLPSAEEIEDSMGELQTLFIAQRSNDTGEIIGAVKKIEPTS